MILLTQSAEADDGAEGEELHLPANQPLTPNEEEQVENGN